MLSLNNLRDAFTSEGKWKITSILALGAGAGIYFVIRKAKLRKQVKALAKKETDNNPYESVKFLNEYLAFDYGGPAVNCLFEEIQSGFDFPKRTADICISFYKSEQSIPNRALDIGCAVGRASFELSQQFSEVIGIDYSHEFIKTCNILKQSGKMEYEVTVEGSLTTKHQAHIPTNLKPENCSFQQGDACNLPLNLGKFGCVLAANLICRLPHPKHFILRLSNLVASGGICVITSPYTFLEDYTKKENWLGGYIDEHGREVRAFETLRDLLNPHFELIDKLDEPFLIRETARKHQWSVAHVTIWRRR